MRYTIETQDGAVEVDISMLSPGRYRVQVGETPAEIVDAAVDAGLVHLHAKGRSFAVNTGHKGDAVHLGARGHQATVELLDPRRARLRARKGGGVSGGGADVVRSPMPGRIVKVLVAVGDTVAEGQGVLIVEAMKMENELRAERAGVVAAVEVKADDLVESGAVLIKLAPPEGDG